MATKYDINYNDSRFKEVEADKKAALNEVDVTYGNMINQADKYYDKQIQASKDWADRQTELQKEQTDFAIEKIEQQKDQAKKDYTKEQSGAYVDWQKQSNQYGANAEQMAANGLTNTGFSESSQVSMYNTYQNRVATARESYNLAVLNYDNAIKDARLQNNSVLAEIAYKALQQQLELSLQGFQYKNQLLIEQSNKKIALDSEYNKRYQDVLQQINHENALAEQVRVNDASIAHQKAQEEIQKAQLAEQQRQFDILHPSSGGSGGGSSGGSGGKVKGSGSKQHSASVQKGRAKQMEKSMGKQKEADPTVTNRHTDSWVEISGHGRFSWSEVLDLVESGTVKETVSNGKVSYTWVGKKAKNVTPDAKGYAAKQKQLFGY